MKKFLRHYKAYGGILLLFSLISCASASHAPRASSWETGAPGYQNAVYEQERRKEPMLLYFNAAWCPYCISFENKTLYKPQVENALHDVIKVRLDADKDPELFQTYGVESMPKLLVVYPDKSTAEIPAYQDPQSFLLAGRKAGLKVRTLS